MKILFCTVFFSILVFISCNDSPYMQGKRLYTANCQNCHMEDGTGLGKLIPPLNKSAILGSSMMACIIKNGLQDTIKDGASFLVKEMPPFGKLSTTEVTNIINFINHSWHKDFKEINISQVGDALKSCL